MAVNMKSFLGGRVVLHKGDCLQILATMAENSVDSVVTDPPYHLTSIVKRFGGANAAPTKGGATGAYKRASAGFMGKQWDGGDIAFQPALWAEVLRVLKPGAHMLAFSGTRTYHRMACAIEDAGFEVRDMASWIYGCGFPKSHNVSKGIDKALGAEREKVPPKSVIGHQRNIGNRRPYMDDPNHMTVSAVPASASASAWQGWGTALKPALEPICLARKPLDDTVAANVLKWGVGALNIDGCRVEGIGATEGRTRNGGGSTWEGSRFVDAGKEMPAGRWPANVIHDGSDEVLAAFPKTVSTSRAFHDDVITERRDNESAARFFYSAKANSDDRLGSKHPTVKPVDLMAYLVRMITPRRGIVLDPFAGTGTTGEAAWRQGMCSVLIEREIEYQADIARRMKLCLSGCDERLRDSIKTRHGDLPAGPLFDF